MMKKFSIYKVISLLAFLILIYILALPQFFNIDRKQNTDECLKNMRILHAAIKQYMAERNEDFYGSQQDLRRTGYLKSSYVCPEGKPDDRYLIKGDLATGVITVRCPHEEEFPDHKLPESMRE
jgi:competence protein ComGC